MNEVQSEKDAAVFDVIKATYDILKGMKEKDMLTAFMIIVNEGEKSRCLVNGNLFTISQMFDTILNSERNEDLKLAIKTAVSY